MNSFTFYMVGSPGGSRNLASASLLFLYRFRPEVLRHENLVVVTSVLLQGLVFDSVFDEAQAGVEPSRRLVLAHDRQLKYFHLLARKIDHRLGKSAAHARFPQACLHVHAPKHSFVRILGTLAAHESRHAYQGVIPEGAKDGAVGHTFHKSFEGPLAFRRKRATERFRITAQRFEADLSICRGLGRAQASYLNLRGGHDRVVTEFSRRSKSRILARPRCLISFADAHKMKVQ